MADIEFSCSQCGQDLVIDGEGAGMEIQCPHCQSPVRVPEKPAEPIRKPAFKLEPAPSTYVPSVPGDDEPAIQEPAGKKLLGRMVKWASMVVLLGVLAVIGYWIWVRVDSMQKMTMARDMMSKLGGLSLADYERRDMTGFMMAAAETAKEIAPLLPRTPTLFKEQCESLGRAQDAFQRTAKLDCLTGIISQLPPDSDLAPVLLVPSTSVVYQVAFKKVADDATIPWLLKKSCSGDAEARTFAAEVLESLLPAPLPTEEANLLPRLSEKMRLAQKQQLYERLCVADATVLEQRLAGSYRLRIDAIYRDAFGKDTTVNVQTKEPCLTIGHKDKKWSFVLFGRPWTGQLRDIRRLSLQADVPDDAFGAPSPFLTEKKVKLTVQVPEDKLILEVTPLVMYEPPRTDSDYGIRLSARAGFAQFNTAMVKAE